MEAAVARGSARAPGPVERRPGGDERREHRSSTGHGLAESGWLDVHYEACRPEYEAMLASVGVEPGWRVLDAGCGSGSFLGSITALVGPAGAVAALDLAPENVERIAQRLRARPTLCPVEPTVGSLLDLPYPDDAFDAAWCGNALQYLPDRSVPAALAEFRRVVRPGGRVAVKDVDMTLFRIAPGDPFLVTHLSEASLNHDPEGWSRGSLRGRELRRWLEAAGLQDVRQRTWLIERWAPLRPVERRLFTDWLAYLAGLAATRNVPPDDLRAWAILGDPSAPDHPVDDPRFYACEGQALAVGHVPGQTRQP